eukprot:111755-Prymnesium_polylepis.1
MRALRPEWFAGPRRRWWRRARRRQQRRQRRPLALPGAARDAGTRAAPRGGAFAGLGFGHQSDARVGHEKPPPPTRRAAVAAPLSRRVGRLTLLATPTGTDNEWTGGSLSRPT